MRSLQKREGLRAGGGFTLIELMIVVVILGVLAAVAIPAFVRHIRRARTAEAEDKLSSMFRSAVSYLDTEIGGRDPSAAPLPPQFPESQAPTPGGCSTCAAADDGRCDPSAYGAAVWDTPTWQALNFAISDPHYFVYEFVSANTGARRAAGSAFTARAQADLDDDGDCSLFERAAVVTPDGDVQGSRGIYRQMPTE